MPASNTPSKISFRNISDLRKITQVRREAAHILFGGIRQIPWRLFSSGFENHPSATGYREYPHRAACARSFRPGWGVILPLLRLLGQAARVFQGVSLATSLAWFPNPSSWRFWARQPSFSVFSSVWLLRLRPPQSLRRQIPGSLPPLPPIREPLHSGFPCT